MEYGVTIPNFRGAAGLKTFRAVATLADRIGLDDVWIGDHIVLSRHVSSPHPYSSDGRVTDRPRPWAEAGIADMAPDDPVYEPLALMGFLAAVTDRVRIALGTLVVPLRNPVFTAKSLATIDVLSGGRVLLGVGVGWIPEEYAALGANWSQRGAVADEYIDLMRILWSDDDPRFEGEHYRLDPGVCFSPKPMGREIPIWVGGNSPPALRRAARIGAGWHGVYVDVDGTADIRRRLAGLMAERGRSFEGFAISMRVHFEVGDHVIEGKPCTGPPERIAESIAGYRAAGLTHLQMATPVGPTTEAITEQIHRFDEQVRPLLES